MILIVPTFERVFHKEQGQLRCLMSSFVLFSFAIIGCQDTTYETRAMSRDTQLCSTGYALEEYRQQHGSLPLADYDPSQREDYWAVIVGMYENGGHEILPDAFAPERLRSDIGTIEDRTTQFYPVWHVDNILLDSILVIEGPSASAYSWQSGPVWTLDEVCQYYREHPDQRFWVLYDDITARQASMDEIEVESPSDRLD